MDKTLSICLGILLALAAPISCVRSGYEALGLSNNLDVDNDLEDADSEPLFCDSYNKQYTRNDLPCTEEEMVDGICNKTQQCDKGKEGSHCFTSWRNESGKVEIVSSGCWLHNSDCAEKRECRTYNNTANNGIYFCCCDGDFCNRNFFMDPAYDTADQSEKEVEPFNEWMILVYVLVPLFIFCCIVILAFWLYRRRKGAYADMECVSVDTPATGTTHCTTMSSFPPMCEMSMPQLIDMKARGRFGKVWRAQLNDHYVAVKTFDLHQKMSWQNEQDIFMTPLMNTHDNILKFLTGTRRGEGNETELWLITEFYERGSLSDYLKANKVTLAEALGIMRSMASGMSFLHEDIQIRLGEYKPAIAHRDFKSKNVLLDNNLNAVIADFGLAVKFTPGESPGESHGQVGTLRYMAPEVLEGAINFQKDAFLRIDMYAFGLVMWEILSRCSCIQEVGEAQLPFEAELGNVPTMDDMQEHVVEKKLRPHIKQEWKNTKQVATVCETMEECWDHDAEARLSAGCVELRIASLQRQQQNMENNETRNPISNEIHSTPLIMPPAQSYDANTQAMNQLNLQMNNSSPPPMYTSGQVDKNTNQQLANEHAGHMTTSLSNPDPNNTSHERKDQEGVFVTYDDDHDSGTFANEDTLSHDGVNEQLLATDNSSSEDSVPNVAISESGHDSATSYLLASSSERESDL